MGKDFLQCKLCGMCFASEASWRKHLLILHRVKKPSPDFYCEDLPTTMAALGGNNETMIKQIVSIKLIYLGTVPAGFLAFWVSFLLFGLATREPGYILKNLCCSYGFVKSRLWKSKSQSRTRLLLDFCQKVDFTRL